MRFLQFSSLGGSGGRRVASSTAVVYISSWRTAVCGIPNLACTISPCSVDRRVPFEKEVHKRNDKDYYNNNNYHFKYNNNDDDADDMKLVIHYESAIL